MGTRVGRSTLFGIPLQQQWSYANSGDFAPTYYLQSDAPLYYYSFTDALHRERLPLADARAEQARFDPMITGFNPADMYGVDHIRRVLTTFPASSPASASSASTRSSSRAKIPGETASLTNPALDRILDFAAEAGLVVILHNDIDMPFAKPDAEPVYLTQMKAVLSRHPKTTIIWAHVGLGGRAARQRPRDDHRASATFGTGTDPRHVHALGRLRAPARRPRVADARRRAVFRVGLAPDELVALEQGAAALEPSDLVGMTASDVGASGDRPLQRALDLLDG